MKKEVIEYKGYKGEIIYRPFFDDSTPLSKQYKLIISKEGKIYIDRYRFTGNGEKTFFHRWVDKKIGKN